MSSPSHAKAEHPETRTQYLTPKQVMEELQLSENVIYRELEYGMLRSISVRIGRQWRISADGLTQLVAGEVA